LLSSAPSSSLGYLKRHSCSEARSHPSVARSTLPVFPHDHLHPTAQALVDSGSYSDPSPLVVVVESGTQEVVQDVVPYASVTSTSLEEAEELRQVKTKATIGVLSTIILYMCTNSILKATHAEAFIWQDEDREEAASSLFWLHRKCCRWLGVCGGLHMRLISEKAKFGHHPKISRKHKLVDQSPPPWDCKTPGKTAMIDRKTGPTMNGC
jgi:hypothetical protein